jgi:hypothetical protein
MKQSIINELKKDYMGTYQAWEEAYKNKNVFLANTLRENLREIQYMIIAQENSI